MEINKNTWKQATRFDPGFALEWETVLPIQEDWKGKKILDFGCGGGRACFLLAKRGINIVGLDILEHNIESAKRNFKENNLEGEFKVIEENKKLSYPNNYFDGIVCDGVLHHIKYDKFIVGELHRVLKPKGVLYLMVYTPDLFKLHLPTITNMIRNTPEKSWQRCFGELTDDCNYSTFYTVSDIYNLFTIGFWVKEFFLYHDYQFRIHRLEKR